MMARLDGLFLGTDPDLSRPSLAAVDQDGSVISVFCFRSGFRARGREKAACAVIDFVKNVRSALQNHPPVFAAAVEGQEIVYSAKRGVNPRDLLNLAVVAGGCLAALSHYTDALYLPSPQEWKGSVPKHIHQARVLARVGWKYAQAGGKGPYCYPISGHENVPGSSDINKSDWKHVVDAIGLALWCRDKSVWAKAGHRSRCSASARTTEARPSTYR